MDRVLEGALTGAIPLPTKITILRNLLSHLEGSEDDVNGNLLVVCLYHLHSSDNITVQYDCLLQQICDYLLIRATDDTLEFVTTELKLKFHVNHIALPPCEQLDRALKHIRYVEENERLDYLLYRLEHNHGNPVRNAALLFRNLTKHQGTRLIPVADNLVRRVSKLLTDPGLHEFATMHDWKDLLGAMLFLLAHLRDPLSDSDKASFSQPVMDLALCIATGLLHIITQTGLDYLVSHLNTKVEELLVSKVTPETCYLPLTTLLHCLDSSSVTDNGETLCRFIISVTDTHLSHTEDCFAILRRLILWLIWPNHAGLSHSSLDKWIVGFICEFFRRSLCSVYTSTVIPCTWSNFMLEQLRLVIKMTVGQNPPSSSILNALAFLLLAGVPTLTDLRYPIFKEEFLPMFIEVCKRYEGSVFSEANAAVNQLSMIVHLLLTSLYPTGVDSENFESDGISGVIYRYYTNVANNIPNSVANDRLKVYQWTTLMRWGSRAGINLHRCWTRWYKATKLDHDSVGSIMRPTQSVVGRNAFDHPGLVNTGNTCYANAAIQLLYHCSGFRTAVLEHRLSSVFPTTVRPTCTPSPVGALATLAERVTALPVDNQHASPLCLSDVPLRTQLLALFRALATQKGPPVRDPGALLTLSRPAHFVSGEQQDAVEYLNYLLERLHEEELHAMKSRISSSHPVCVLHNPSDSSGDLNGSCTGLDTAVPTADSMDLSNERFVDCESSFSRNDSSLVNGTIYKEQAVTVDELSLVHRLFGGELVRYTSCTECSYVSSTRQEHFSLLYLPVAAVDELSPESDGTRSYISTFEVESNTRLVNADVDLTSLIRAHFTRIEYVPSQQKCESCGQVSKRARRLSLRSLASHVLICLNVFTFCRVKQTGTKVLQKIAIPERLSVTFSEHTVAEDPKDSASETSRTMTSRSYLLQGMILHHGMSISCGHYTCVTRVGMQWILFDDDTAEYTTLDEVYEKPLTTPYLLLYTQATS